MNSAIIGIFRVFYVGLITIMPSYLYYLGHKIDIIPAIDICVLYYFTTYNNVRPIMAFLIGILLDTLHGIPIGASSLALVSANYVLTYTKGIILIRNYYTNILIFAVYSLYILILRYMCSALLDDRSIDPIAFIFHILTTITIYPVIKFMLRLALPVQKENNTQEVLEK